MNRSINPGSARADDPVPLVSLSAAERKSITRSVRASLARAIVADVVLMTLAFGVVYVASEKLNLFELIVRFVQSRDELQLDEMVISLTLLPVFLLYVVPHRWHQTYQTLVGKKISERAVANAASSYRELFDSSTAGVSRWGPDGSLQLANPAFAAMVGAEMVSPRLRLGDLMDEPTLAGLLQRVREGGEREPVELRWHAGVRGINVKVTSRFSGERASGAFDLYTHDVSSERHLEHQLRHAQKMDGIGRLAGGIAHDFNNLLTVILNEAELAKDALAPDAPAQEGLAGVLRAGERATILTRQLLTFSRRDTVNPTVFAPGDVVTDMARMLERLIGADVELKTRVEPGLAVVRADRSQVEQVVLNLAVNARDAMPAGGHLTVETGPRHLDEAYAAINPGVVAGEYVMIAVSDTGSGMTTEVKDRLFEPFFTTKSAGRGTGLGLATCFGIVANAGGHIGVYSEPGLGTTMRVYLPRSLEVVSVANTAPAILEPAAHDATILVVEDEPAVRKVVVQVLQRQGYSVLEAANGAEAIRHVEDRSNTIDLIISDMVMPGVSGRELAEQIAEIQPGIKLMFISGYTDDVVLKHQMLEQHVPFLQKPFTVAGFANAVNAVVQNDDSLRVGELGAMAR